MKITKTLTIAGEIVGTIWMPAAECYKEFSVSDNQYPFNAYFDGSRPTIRDMALHVTNDGDFQQCHISGNSVLIFERTTWTKTGPIKKQRIMYASQFPSIADCVGEEFYPDPD